MYPGMKRPSLRSTTRAATGIMPRPGAQAARLDHDGTGADFARFDHSGSMIIPNMSSRTKNLLRDGLTLVGVLAILTLLAHGQIAATVLIMVPLMFVWFGRSP